MNGIGTVCSFHRNVRPVGEQDFGMASVFAARAAGFSERYGGTRAFTQRARLEQALKRRTSELRGARQQLIRRERLAALGELAAKIVHEMRSPLSTMTMALDHLSRLDLPEASRRRLVMAQEEAERLGRLLGEVLEYARPTIGGPGWVDVNALIVRTVTEHDEAMDPSCEGRRTQCRLCEERVGVLANRDKLQQVLLTLLGNARDASPVGSDVVIETETLSDRGTLTIRVRNRMHGLLDTGRVLEPFYSTKLHGTGLGLCIVTGIVTNLRGRFSIKQATTGEVIAKVVLPALLDTTPDSSDRAPIRRRAAGQVGV